MNPHQEEFIGKHITIIDASNISLRGMTGTIVDETKHTFVIQTTRGKKRALKKGATFGIVINGTSVTIHGTDIEKTPEERIRHT